MNNKILTRILQATQVPELLDILSQRLSPSDLHSLLLEVYRQRTQTLAPAQLLQQYEQNRLVKPSLVSPVRLLEMDRMAYALLPDGFEAVELSPVCPLGTSAVVAPIAPDKAVATIRNTEVCSDATNVLALEAAERRRAAYRHGATPTTETKLCASQRLLRPHSPAGPASFSHFRIFSLVTAGRDRGSFGFEAAALHEQLDFYLRFLHTAQHSGYSLGAVRVELLVFDPIRNEVLQQDVIKPLAPLHPNVHIALIPKTHDNQTYYDAVRFQIYAQDPQGTEFFIIDGGFTDWTQQLLSNRKERLLISGLGSERFVACFG